MTKRWLAMLGLALMVPIALGLLRGTLSLEVAGIRALVLVVALALVERILLPFVQVALLPTRRRPERPAVPGGRREGDADAA